jgi:hypothetical protein
MAAMFFCFVAVIVAYAFEEIMLFTQVTIDNLRNPIVILLATVDPPAYLFFFPIIIAGFFAVWVILSLHRWKADHSDISFSTPERPSVDVVLTAYNDEASIGKVVRDFKSHPLVKQVVVVNNNSQDATEQIALQEGAIARREVKQGYGYACIAGLRYARQNCTSEYIALCEGDGTFLAADLDKMLPYLSNVDMVVGTRTTNLLAASDSQMDWFYLWGNLFMAKLIQLKFFDVRHWGRIRITDVGCTYRLMKKEVLERITDSLTVGGHHFSPHMTMVAISRGVKVIEVPVTFSKRIGESKGAGGSHSLGFKVGLRMIWHILWF